VVDLSVGDSAVCAVVDAGAVRCWGLNTAQGWLGFMSADCGPYPSMGTSVDQPCETSPRAVLGVAAATGVATSGDHTCATTEGGGLVCWGADDFGQLGDGFSGSGIHPTTPVVVPLLDVTRVVVGASHTCAIAGSARRVECWGDNSYGQLGIGTNALGTDQSSPIAIPTLTGVSDLTAAEQVSCVVLADATVRCWGDPTSLFPPSAAAYSTSPTAAVDITHAAAVRTGGAHACALRADKTVACWGLDNDGQLGNGMLSLGDYTPSPVQAP
jgi:alpha-tubulin suppressor-like RCC1 family protein